MTFDEWLKSVTPAGRAHLCPEDLRAAWDASRRVALEQATTALENLRDDIWHALPDYDSADKAAVLVTAAIRALAAEPKGTP